MTKNKKKVGSAKAKSKTRKAKAPVKARRAVRATKNAAKRAAKGKTPMPGARREDAERVAADAAVQEEAGISDGDARTYEQDVLAALTEDADDSLDDVADDDL